jgi:hypothetical protein
VKAGAAVVVAAWLAVAGTAPASIWITDDARPALRVDARGTAVVSWRSGGARQTVLVPARGHLTHGGSLAGADVSKPASVPGLPLALAVRRTPDGTLWALQAWQVQPSGPAEVHLARWKGAPTKLTLSSDGLRLTGSASFQGKPVTGRTFTLEGKRPRIFVYLDCFACPAAHGGGWGRMLGVAPRADGSFAVRLRPDWIGKRYRATVAGPNIGTTFAPDARAVVSTS